MTRRTAALLLTLAAVAAVFVARRAGGPLAAGVPSYRIQGPSGAPVTIVVFSDFQCPNCARAEPILKALMDRHPGEVRFFFRHNPLRMHRWARPAAQAAEAAGVQGKFWAYHDVLFHRQADWSEARDPGALFLSYARELGLDETRFQRDLAEGRWDALLDADVQAARAANVNATPTFFIGGQRTVGAAQLEADGERMLQEALR